MRRYLIAALLVTTLVPVAHADDLTGRPAIVDGDTMDLQGVRIRLHGIDAPEAGQKCNEAPRGTWQCGEAAMDRLEELANGGVTCRGHEYDDYGRLIATCYRSDGTDINKTLVAEGYAWAFRKYSEDYAAEEGQARAEKIVIWQADTQTAWDYRASKWKVAVQEAPKGCPIKGNISKRGKIYHMPWNRDYRKTGINIQRGERWFCDEKDAISAGWRPAMR